MSITLRLMKDYESILKDIPDGVVEIILIDNDISKWRVTMQCLETGPLKSHIVCFDILFPVDYPHTSPIVKFVNQIYHPNIDFKSGQLCSEGKWCAVYDVRILLLTVRSLLSYPNIEEPVNIEAAIMFSNDLDTFNEISTLFIEIDASYDEVSLLYVDEDDQRDILDIIEETNNNNAIQKLSQQNNNVNYGQCSGKPRQFGSVENDNQIHKYARENNALALEKMLNDKQCEINAINRNGNTGLHIACNFGYEACVSLLLNFGANTSIINKHGRTAYDCAVFNGQDSVRDLLLNANQISGKRHRENDDSEHDNANDSPTKKSKNNNL